MTAYAVVIIGCMDCGRPVRVLIALSETDARELAARAPLDPTLRGGVPPHCATAHVMEVGDTAVDTDGPGIARRKEPHPRG